MLGYGQFYDFCRDSGDKYATIPVCNLFNEAATRRGTGFGRHCVLYGIPLSGGRHLTNLGSILLCIVAIAMSGLLIWRSNLKRAAVGRREMQIFLAGFILIEFCEIFTVGGFPLESGARRGFSALHIAAVVATSWVLMLNGLVGYQLIEDGTPMSLGLVLGSASALFIGTGYIAFDTAFSWTGFWSTRLVLSAPNQAYALYTLYQLAPLIFIATFFLLETYLVLRILGETRPMIYLAGAALLFFLGQVFQYLISVHICTSTHGKINGGVFETLFTLLAVGMMWIFWSSITEDDWPMPSGPGYT